MKRKSKPWQEKVDEFCRKYLEVHREARRLMSQVKTPDDLFSYAHSPNPAGEIFQQHPELREMKTITLAPEFVQMVEVVPWLKELAQAGEHEYPARMANILDMMQTLVLFPSLAPEVKLNGYFMRSLLIVMVKDFLGSMRRMQYGAEPLDDAKIATLAAQFFETLAQFCRGRIPQAKGRYNLELVGLVKMIEEHQTEKLSAEDLRQTVMAAGVTVPEGETWRIWLWRAGKDGLIARRPARARGHSKKP
jgi:hypothetical protein